MRFKEFLQQVDEAPDIAQPVQVKLVKAISGRNLMKKLASTSNDVQEAMEAALAGYMNRELNASQVARIAQKARVNVDEVLSVARLTESEGQKYKDFHQWMQACKDAHPDFAKEMRFKIDGDDHVAYVRGLDRIFGIWTGDDDGEGVILESKMKDAGTDMVELAIQKMPKQPGMSTRQYVLDLVDVVLSLDKHDLFKGDRETVEAFIKGHLGL